MFPSVENAGFPAAAGPRPPSGLLALQRAERARQDGAAPAGEGEAWAEVLAAWDDEERHRAYLARFTDLDGLAVAGRRYREALLARPGDAIAARFRDEVVRRAVAQGLATLPRGVPAVARARSAARLAAVALAAALAVAALLAAGAWAGAAP